MGTNTQPSRQPGRSARTPQFSLRSGQPSPSELRIRTAVRPLQSTAVDIQMYTPGWTEGSGGVPHVAWLARENVAWRADVWIPAEHLEQVAGEDYRRVPRHIDDPDF